MVSRVSGQWPSAVLRRGFMAGARDAVPGFVAGAIWGFVTGIAMVKSGLSENMAVLMTLSVYAGSAQLTSLPLIQAGAPLWLILAAGCIVNMRFIIFGAAMHPYIRHFSWQRRLMLGFVTSDIAFVLFMTRYGKRPQPARDSQLGYFLGIVVPGWCNWNLASICGIYLGALVPDSWSLEFAAILALSAIVLPLLRERPMLISAASAGVVAWMAQGLPLRLGLLVAVVVGILVGMVAERQLASRRGRRA